MRPWAVRFVAFSCWLVSGCADPLVVPVVMPGSKPITVVSESDAAQAIGEAGQSGTIQVPTSSLDISILPATPTKPGETATTATVLAYTTLKEGTGPAITAGQTAIVHYEGMLDNGSKFDSSRDRGKPFTFQIGAGQVIRGWEVGVAGMLVGETRRLMIPPELGYGAKGSPPVIPPNSKLVFEVELLGVQ